MTEKTNEGRILKIAQQYLKGGPDFDLNANFFEVYNANGLDEIEILIACEEEFEMELPDIDYKSLNDFLVEIEKQQKA